MPSKSGRVLQSLDPHVGGRFFLSYTGRSTCSISTYTGIFIAIYFGMKPLPKLLLALTAVAALSFAYPAKANLIQNPGFEDGAFPWAFSGGAGLSLGAGHSGNWAGYLETGGFTSISQSITTTPGATYTIDFFVRNSNSLSSGTLNVTFGGTTVYSHLFTGLTNYVEVTVTGTASGGNTTLSFLSSNDGAGKIYLDDISVEPAGVGVPDGGTTVSLLGCALVGLAAVRRRLGC